MENQAREALTDLVRQALAGLIRQAYSQPARGWHNMAHLRRMAVALDFPPYMDKDYALAMKTAMYWHDFVYEPGSLDNEAKSEEAMRMVLKPTPVTEEAARLIQATALPITDAGYTLAGTEPESVFCAADWCGLDRTSDMDMQDMELLGAWERGIQHEYGPNTRRYREGRMEFLQNAVERGFLSKAACDFVVYLMERPTRVAVYAGSFLPFHVGHYDIYMKACRVFDHVVVARGVNPDKRDISHRWVRGDEPVAIESFGGMLVDYLHAWSTEVGEQVTLVRGLRDGYDLMQEFQFNQVLQDQAKHRGYPPVPIFYIRGDVGYQHVSSSVVRALPEQERDLYLPRKWDWRAALKAFVDTFGQQEPEELDIFKEP